MRTALKSCCLYYLLATAPGCAKKTVDPQAVLEKAIAAHGGEANLTKRRKGRAWGVDTGPGTRLTWEEVFDAPGRWVKRTKGKLNGQEVRNSRLFNDGVLMMSVDGGDAKEIPAANADPQAGMFGLVAMLLRMRQPAVKLSPLAEVNIEGKAAVGFKFQGERTGEYFFDKETGLLRKLVGDMTGRAGKAVVTLLYGDYREVDGVKLPHRLALSIDGEAMAETVVSGVELLGKIEPEVFNLP